MAHSDRVFTTALRELIRTEVLDILNEQSDDPKSDDVFIGKVETIIANSGFSLIADDVDEAIGDYIRNHVTVELNT